MSFPEYFLSRHGDGRRVTRVIAEEDFLDFLRDLLLIVKDESHKRIANAGEAAHMTKDKREFAVVFQRLQTRQRGISRGVMESHPERRRLEGTT